MKRKVGFLGKFKASNVNLADPIASSKWDNLTKQTRKFEKELTKNYDDNSFLNNLVKISSNDDEPDKLVAYGRNLDEFINTVNKKLLKKDKILLKIVKYYSETSIASNDKYAIDLADSIMQKILDAKSG